MANNIKKGVTMSNEIKIRSLTVRDRKTLSFLIQKLSEKAGDHSIVNMISSQVKQSEKSETESKEEDYVQLGLRLLKSILEVFESETHEWFSDLIGVEKDKFLDLPIDTEIEIINQIVDAQESSNFFIKALQLYNRIKKYQNKQGKQRKK